MLSGAASAAASEKIDYPARPVRLIVSSAVGGGADFMGRIIALKLSENQGYAMVVDNRGGAGGVIGTELVAKAAPDGYTLGLANNTSHIMAPVFNRTVPYHPLRDFTPISLISYAPLMLVAAMTVPAHTVPELIALAQAKPDTLNYASSSNGSLSHLAGALLRINTGIKVVNVPYKSSGLGLTALLSGEAHFMFVNMPAALPYVQGGRIRALAVTGAKRSALLPAMPTLAESGVRDFDINPWFGVLGPARLPPAIVRKLHDDIAACIQTDETKRLLAAQGAEAVGSTPEEFTRVIKQELALWTRIAERTGLRVD
jgi:tripartite-type tricarboxylate transporter receptor subunit TctC